MSNKYTQFQLRVFQKIGVIPVFTNGNPLITQLNKKEKNETLNAWCLRVIGLPFKKVRFYSLTKCSSQTKVENLSSKNLKAQKNFNDQVRNLQANIISKMKVRSDNFVQPAPQALRPRLVNQTMRDAVLLMPSSMEEFIEGFVRWQDKGIECPYALESFFERYVELATHAINANLLEDEDDFEDDEFDDGLDFESTFTFTNDDDDDDDDDDGTGALLEITEEDKNNAREFVIELSEKPEVLTINNDFRLSEHSNYDDFTADYGMAARYMILLDDLDTYVCLASDAFNYFTFVDFSNAVNEFNELLRVIEDIQNEAGFPAASDLDDPEEDRTEEEKEQVEYIQSCVADLINNIQAAFDAVDEDIEEFWDEVSFEYEDEEDNQDKEFLEAKKAAMQIINQISDACGICQTQMLDIANLLFEG
jgi:hypothetical protein